MSRRTYGVGSMVVVKAGLTRVAAADRTCCIVGILPADHGEAQYRVRFGNETFERRIVETDIDQTETAVPPQKGDPPSTSKSEPWLKASRIRIGK